MSSSFMRASAVALVVAENEVAMSNPNATEVGKTTFYPPNAGIRMLMTSLV
jgi:hypothetical protein